MKETIIYIPRANEAEMLRTFAKFNKNTFAVRVLNTLGLSSLMLSRIGAKVSRPNISTEFEAFIYKSILRNREKIYFTGSTIDDAKNIRDAINNLRSLVIDDSLWFNKLSNSPFKEKNIDLYEIYIEYLEVLNKKEYIDSKMILREAIIKGIALEDIEFITFDEFIYSPNELLLIKKASNNNYKRMSFFSFLGIDEKESIPFKVQECHGEYNEVLNVIDYINKNNLKLDECLLVVTNNKYSSIIDDFSSNLNISVTNSIGRPLKESIAGRLLKSLLNWNTKGMNGLTALQDVFSYLDKEKIKEAIDINDCEEKGKNISSKILNQLITYMGNLKISFDKNKNEEKLLEFHTAKFNSKELYSEYLDKLVHEIEQGYSYIIDNYLTVERFDEASAKNKVVRFLEQYYFSDKEEYISDILETSFNASLSKPQALHVVTLDNALEALRPNVFILGMSADFFPGVSNESYVVLDSEYTLVDPNNNLTKAKKTINKLNTLSNLLDIASKLGIKINMSYSSYSISDVKSKNKASAIYDYDTYDNVIDYSTNPYINKYVSSYLNGMLINPSITRNPIDQEFMINPCDLFKGYNSLSPSSLEAIYLEPSEYTFFLRNILGITSPEEKDPLDFSDAAGFGNIIHEALEGFDRSEMTKKMLLDHGDDIFDNYALKHYGSDKEYQRRRMKIMLTNAYSMVKGHHSNSELVLNGEIEGISFYGRVDRIERTDDGFAVVDYKTGKVKHKIKNPYTFVQGIIYSNLYNNSDNPGEASTIKFDYLKSKTIVEFKNDSKVLESLMNNFKNKVSKLDFDMNYLSYYHIIRGFDSNPSNPSAPKEKFIIEKKKKEKGV